jgi:hypothetical protein
LSKSIFIALEIDSSAWRDIDLYKQAPVGKLAALGFYDEGSAPFALSIQCFSTGG